MLTITFTFMFQHLATEREEVAGRAEDEVVGGKPKQSGRYIIHLDITGVDIVCYGLLSALPRPQPRHGPRLQAHTLGKHRGGLHQPLGRLLHSLHCAR